jgi:hypothetical protein
MSTKFQVIQSTLNENISTTMAPINDAIAAIAGEKRLNYSFIAKKMMSTEELLL